MAREGAQRNGETSGCCKTRFSEAAVSHARTDAVAGVFHEHRIGENLTQADASGPLGKSKKFLDAVVSALTLRVPSSFNDRRGFLRVGVSNPKGKRKCHLEV